jgi:hypothetical protein
VTSNVGNKLVPRLTADDRLMVRAFVREEDAQPGADSYGWKGTA